MSPRCISCSGRRQRLPGDPVNSVTEKLTVVGETFPPEDTERLCECLMRVASGGADIGGEIDLDENPPEMIPSSVISIVMLLGGVGNIEEVVLTLLSCVFDDRSYVDGILDVESWRSCVFTKVVLEDELKDEEGCSLCTSSAEFALDLEFNDSGRGSNVLWAA
jgi:hypothetical protein